MSYIAKIKSFKNTRKYEYMSMRFGEVVNFSMIISKIAHNGGGGKQIECKYIFSFALRVGNPD